MLYPLIALWRHNFRVNFYESDGVASGGLFDSQRSTLSDAVLGQRHSFYSASEAQSYLRFWLADPSARSQLMWLIHRTGTNSENFQGGDGWIDALANRLLLGGLIAMEESNRLAAPGRLTLPPKASSIAAALAGLPSLASVPAVPVVVPLLPALEDLQIETAEVMPEINQSLVKVDQTLVSVGSVSASLSPTTAGVADIQTAVNEASSRTSKQLADM
jgi:hypothetical protein